MSKREIKDRIVELLSKVGLEARSKDLYPHEFSGGQRQRIAVARALATKPRFVILDEPVSALDVSIRAQIMNLLQELQEDSGIGYLLISHDLTTAIHLSHRVEVIYSGQVVESIPANRIYHGAVHPYTQALLKSASPDQLRKQTEEFVLPGEVPDPLNFPLGCRFHPRCAEKMAKCSLNEPPLQKVTNDHHVRCHLYTH
jgi:oligopeptide/dipeptide ABC transporter ATP-binding protein